jgi:type IV pilus assembly protein PilA
VPLIELLVVIAMIGVLATVALPAYQDYTMRAQISESLALSSAGSKSVVAEFKYGHFPGSSASASIAYATESIADSHVTQAWVDKGNEMYILYSKKTQPHCLQ